MHKQHIINAIIWATMIVVTSVMISGKVDKKTSFSITMFHIAGWMATNGWTTKGNKKESSQ